MDRTDKQATLDKRWSFIRACFLIAQRRTNGFLSCMECGLIVRRARELDLAHIEPKLAPKFTPSNAQLLCNRLSANKDQSCSSRKGHRKARLAEEEKSERGDELDVHFRDALRTTSAPLRKESLNAY